MVHNLITALVVEVYNVSMRRADTLDDTLGKDETASTSSGARKRGHRRERMTSAQNLYAHIEPWNMGKDALRRSYARGSLLLDDELLRTAQQWVAKKIIEMGEQDVHTVHDLVAIYHAKHCGAGAWSILAFACFVIPSSS